MMVGSKGITFVDKKGRVIESESVPYMNIARWQASRRDNLLRIEINRPAEKVVIIGTKEGEEIGLLIRSHAENWAKISAAGVANASSPSTNTVPTWSRANEEAVRTALRQHGEDANLAPQVCEAFRSAQYPTGTWVHELAEMQRENALEHFMVSVHQSISARGKPKGRISTAQGLEQSLLTTSDNV